MTLVQLHTDVLISGEGQKNDVQLPQACVIIITLNISEKSFFVI